MPLLLGADPVAHPLPGRVVRAVSSAELARAMELGALAGQLGVASDFVAAREMPVLAAFLEDKGNLLRVFAVDSIKRAGATRALAQAMAATGAKVGEMGANEVAEGLVRMAIAEGGAQRSADLFADGAMNAAGGAEVLAAAQGARQVAREMEKTGVKQVAAGTEVVGQAETMGVVAVALDEAAQ